VTGAVDLAIDGGRLPGTPSTVVDLTKLDEDGAWSILREGALSREAVAAALE
jgi:L-threonylcarbamoyladenylate synthase